MYHDQYLFCNADYEIVQAPADFDPSRDIAPPPAKRRRKGQCAVERAERMATIQAARSVAAHAEVDAGPSLHREIDEEKALERACDGARLRDEMTKVLLMQRAGLFKLCNTESSNADYDHPTPRVQLYFDHMLMISANLAALSGSGWASTWGWFRDRLPLPSDKIGRDVLETQFNIFLAQAAAKLASRPVLRVWDLRTAPSAEVIAETFGTTMAQLRAAKANLCRLTGIDAKPKRERDRATQETKRRKAGMKAQADRTIRQRDIELAALAGCSDRYIRKLRSADRLADYLFAKGLDVPEAKAAITGNDSSQNNRLSKEIKTRHFWELRSPARGRPRVSPGIILSRAVPMTSTARHRPRSRTRLAA